MGGTTPHTYLYLPYDIFFELIFYCLTKTYSRISGYRFLYLLRVYNVTHLRNPFIPYVSVYITLINNSIIKLSFKEDKKKSVRSHKGEIIKNNLQFCKLGYMITPSVRDSDMANQHYLRSCGYISLFIVENQPNCTRQKDNLVKIKVVGNTLEHWGFVTKEVPVESFVGRQQVPVVRGKD